MLEEAKSQKIFIILSPKIPEYLINKIKTQDYVLVGAGIDTKRLKANIRYLKDPSYNHQKDITKQIASKLEALENTTSKQILECFINDFYSYSIKPSWSYFLSLQSIISNTGISNITIVCAKYNGKKLPMTGFQTTESKRGSPLLLGAYLGTQFPKAFPNAHFTYEYVTRDVFCIEPLRKFIIQTANIYFCGNFFVKSLWSNWAYNKKSKTNSSTTTLLIRTEHQKRFAIKLLKESKEKEVSIIIMPQLSQGSLLSLKNLYSNTKNQNTHHYPLSLLIKSIQAMISDIIQLKKQKYIDDFKITCSKITLGYSFNNLIEEILLVSIVLLYKNTLKEIVIRGEVKTLVNFELVGRMAGVEALIAKQAKINLKSIQTALVSESPNIIFPVSPIFFTDGENSVNYLSKVGAIKRGILRYAGAPFNVQNCVFIDNTFRHITFFTQPYEPIITLSILNKLVDWCINHNSTIIIKLHPRDDRNIYQKLLLKHPNITRISNDSPELLLDKSNLCITRTSSVAKEAFALGIPVILCLWSEFDRSISADYISGEPSLQYRSYDKEDIHDILNDPEKIYYATKSMNSQLFSAKGITNLADEVFS